MVSARYLTVFSWGMTDRWRRVFLNGKPVTPWHRIK